MREGGARAQIDELQHRRAPPRRLAGGISRGASGVHFMQGCLFGRPVAKEAMTERLAEKQAAASRFGAAGVAV
jgi:hypothetical protein